MSIKTVKSDNKNYCKSIAQSISEVLRFSLDEEFRKNTFELFGASCTKQTEREIHKRLLSLIKNGSFPQCNKVLKKHKNLFLKKGTENTQEYNDTSSKRSCNNSGSQTLSESLFQRNWLQVSTQQYKNIIKRRKSNYFSQPQFRQSSQEKNFNFGLSYSQPIYFTPFPSLEKKTKLSSEFSDNRINYSKKMFEEDNALKHFKNNLKPNRHNNYD